MKIELVSACIAGLLLATTGLVAQQSNRSEHAPPVRGIYWAKGAPHSQAKTSGSPDMTNHGGPIMTSSYVQAIFWGTSWAGYTGDEITGMDSWYMGFSNSNYAKTSDEYTSGNTQVGPVETYNGHIVDTTAAQGGSNTAAILAEVCKEITKPVSNGYYPVYVDLPPHGNYCAWHSAGTCQGVTVQFAFFWKLDGAAGCDPQSSVAGQSEGLQALANVSGHELSEARTDPQLNAWYDSSGAENGDKCAWTFGAPYVTFSNKTSWKIQGEWSNAAYNAGTGYPNSSGQKGCLSGK